jgi:DNA-binding LytR/AlgR family response regulator
MVAPLLARTPQYSLTENRRMSNSLLAKNETLAHENARFLMGRTKDRTVPISLEAITTIEAVGGFAVVHTVGGSFILRQTLATLEKALPGSTFARMNRSLILNISQIEELQVLGGGGNHFRMKDGRIVALTLQLSEMESLLRDTTN